MLAIPANALFAVLERHNGMDRPQADAPIAHDPLNSDDPKIREAARALAAAACASQVA